MNVSHISLYILTILCLLFWIIFASSPPDSIAISCGSSGSLTAPDGRLWVGDNSGLFPLQINGKSSNSRAIHKLDSLLYKTARISRHEFSYTFPVKPGQKFIRLHYHQDSYKGFKKSKALFTVKAGPYTLLSNFSTALTSTALGVKQIIKEYCLNIDNDEALTITFSPAQNTRKSDDFYAFINCIEVVSMPTGLYFTPEGELGARVVGQKYRFYIDNSTALEMVQRLNVGGTVVSPTEDSILFRRWDEDSHYLLETGVISMKNTVNSVKYGGTLMNFAPRKVYQSGRSVYTKLGTGNLTWKISVDLGFRYLIRLHFSELQPRIEEKIRLSTSSFDPKFHIGSGGYGRVYKGSIDGGDTIVAIKRLRLESKQGDNEFWTEIKMLSKIRHQHLVSLIGYCNDGHERLLVYHYMTRGTLADHLYKINRPGKSILPLSWELRLKISVGAARGLYYLHSRHRVIHRDVKSSNILLDENWVAKISDFGLSKMGPDNDSFTHISTNVKGTFGYLDPEYFLTRKLTRKSDVYAFGVVLFEVLSGRPAVDIRLGKDQHSLAGWARYCIREGIVDRLIDENLVEQISPACLKVFVGIAGRCLHTQPHGRPAMADVVMGLELALALQQTTDPMEQVEEEENAGRSYSDQSYGAIAMDDISISPPKGESERISSEDILGSDSRTRGSDQRNAKTKTKDNSSNGSLSTRWWWDPFGILPRTPSKSRTSTAMPPQVVIHHFSVQEIQKATNNFHNSLIIGYGGSDNVYKGYIDGGHKVVAIRWSRTMDSRLCMANELQAMKEIQMKSSPIQHHTSFLIGYCETESDMMLVYAYMANGTLHDHLHEPHKDPLSWKRRLQICIGAARGLSYLHSIIKKTMLHRDLKSTNIWLDDSWIPKVSLWGLSKKTGNSSAPAIGRGNWAHLDSDYIRGYELTEKSYVYSFGLVLFEVLCAGKESDRWLDEDQVSLGQWIKSNMRSNLSGCIDSFLVGRASHDSLKLFIETAGRCLLDYGIDRPSMSDIITRLEVALNQQEAAEGNKGAYILRS
ncbi:hypothetical protein ACJIZ3_001993 [Penstemon smallii]|uniref:Protein kinase domain-containing protein n=1 Tax=Penstemon smallii TaxID=265156 RepID=A0ABD3U6K7_9LAMI